MLLSYAWHADSCFPRQIRLAEDLGTSDRSVRNFLNELKARGLITWKQRGLSKPNVYYILDFKPLKIEADRKPTSGLDRNWASAYTYTAE